MVTITYLKGEIPVTVDLRSLEDWQRIDGYPVQSICIPQWTTSKVELKVDIDILQRLGRALIN